MFKLFKTKEERDLAFVSKLWERPKRTDKLKEVLSYSQTPYEITAYLSDPELNKGFRYKNMVAIFLGYEVGLMMPWRKPIG